MLRDRLKVFYILSLLVLASLLVLFVQGVFSGMSADSAEPAAEITRIDLYNEIRGNYSLISVMFANNDTVSHNFSIDTFYGEELADSFNVTVNTSATLTYRTYVYPEEIPISEYGNNSSTLRVAKLVVYIDERPEPFEEASFVFNNE